MTITRKNPEPGARPSIGINMDMEGDGKGPYYFSRMPYAAAVWKAGGRPVMIPPMEGARAHESLEGLHGLLLTGGDDLDPALYGGGGRHTEEVPLHPVREAFDMDLVKAAMAAGIPTLAICLGLQELCVAFGGGLHPFIPDAVPHAMDHRTPEGGMVLHPLEIEPGTCLAGIMPSGTEVNSGHRQAVSHPGEGFRVAASTRDGVIEAVESRAASFVLGVQWHPELMTEEPAQAALFTALVAQARAYIPLGGA